MGIAYYAGTRGKLMRRAAARPSSLWWRSAVVHRWGWVRGAEEIINEDTESCAFGQGHRSPALTGLCPCGGGKGGLLCFLSGDEVAWGLPWKPRVSLLALAHRGGEEPIYWWLSCIFDHLRVLEIKVSPLCSTGGCSILPPTLLLNAADWTQLRWFSGCWLKGQRRRVGWIPPEKQQEKKKKRKKTKIYFLKSGDQLCFWTTTSAVVVAAVHGAELGLQEWWRRWVSQWSVLPEWGKLL